MLMTRLSSWIACLLAMSLLAGGAAAGDDELIEHSLKQVRDVKKGMFDGQSSVLGKLPDAEETARQQLRTRPIPKIPTNPNAVVAFDAERMKKLTAELKRRLGKLSKDKKGKFASAPLGITGGRMADDYFGRQDFLIVDVQPGTPAAGKLQANDIIIGANGRLIADPEDPRPEIGYALVNSQTPQLGGILTLHVVRQGKGVNVKLDLGSKIAYSETWPYKCEKTKQIRAAALKLVMENGPAAKGLMSRHSSGGFWTPLFLMASGDKAAMAKVTEWIRATTKPASEYPEVVAGKSSWVTGYEMINVAEYYLLTKDRNVLPRLRYLGRVLEKNQFPSGGWSHGTPPGYGEINNAGLACFIGLILSRECGLEGDAMKFAKSIRYFGKYCGTNFGYGLGTPGGRSGRMDNGMHGMAAVAFGLLGEKEMARRWARPLCYMWLGRERGHAEGIFSPMWGSVGADYAPKPEFNMFMKHMLWYYELCRTPEGGMVFLRGTRFPYPGGVTPAMTLFLYLPEHRIRILGAPKLSSGRTK
jgi:hypothetical protein